MALGAGMVAVALGSGVSVGAGVIVPVGDSVGRGVAVGTGVAVGWGSMAEHDASKMLDKTSKYGMVFIVACSLDILNFELDPDGLV